jgi:hypothetical protein
MPDHSPLATDIDARENFIATLRDNEALGKEGVLGEMIRLLARNIDIPHLNTNAVTLLLLRRMLHDVAGEQAEGEL